MANTRPKSKTDYIHVRIEPRIKEAARVLAAGEGISLSDLVSRSIRLYAKARSAQASG